MTSPLDAVLARMREIQPEMKRLAQLPGKLSSSQSARWDELTSEWDELEERKTELEERGERAKAAAVVNFGNADRRTTTGRDEFRDQAFRNIETAWFVADDKKDAAYRAVEVDGRGPIARYCAMASDHNYMTAFSKLLTDPMTGHQRFTPEESRAFTNVSDELRTMTAGTGSSGGYMVPLYMDPSFVITGAGSRNPFRQVSNVKHISTLTYNGSTAGQITAGLLGENAAFSDNSPTVAQVQLPTYKIGAYIPASFEAFEDIATLAADVSELFADAKTNYEATQFATGSGSAPHGVVTDVGAVTASRVSPATGGTYAIADVYSVHGALPPRYRNGDPAARAWMANVATIDKTRQFATANNYHAFLTDLGGGQPSQLLGDQLFESSAMSSSYTTGQDILLVGDFTKFYIVDRIAPMVEFIPNVFDQSTGRPSGTRAWLFHWRIGSGVADTNAFRLLRL